jgi:hypothetical protein
MRKLALILLPMAVLALAGVSLQAEEGVKWLDPQNCYFCQPLTETEGLMEHVSWENYKIANGIVSVTTYAPEWKDKMKAASAAMQKRWAEYDPTKEYHMCGMCRAWTQLPLDKIKMENVEFTGGELSLSTSDDPAIVAKLHEIADKTTVEMATMMQEMEKKPEAEAEE